MQKPILLDPPASLPVTLEEVKLHLRVDWSDDDDLINVLMSAATNHLDGYSGILGRCLMQQVWRVSALRFVSNHIRLPFEHVADVSVKYLDDSDVEQVVPADQYEVLTDSLGSYVKLNDAFSHPALSSQDDPAWVEQTSGAELPGDVPAQINLAIKMMVAHYYEHRDGAQSGIQLPPGVQTILAPLRKWSL